MIVTFSIISFVFPFLHSLSLSLSLHERRGSDVNGAVSEEVLPVGVEEDGR